MKKLSKILNESAWGEMRKRSAGDTLRREDFAAEVEIDGVKYTFAKDFWKMGEEFNEENFDEWTCFAFNKMPDGSTIISGDTEQAGVFGRDKWDIGDWSYDVYVLRDFIEKSKEELIQDAVEHGNINAYAPTKIEKICKDFLEELYKEHMSDFAHYWIYELHNSDWSDDAIIWIYTVLEDLPDSVVEEFSGHSIEEADQFVFPILNNTDWAERLEAALASAYEELGYKQSNEYELDPFSGPGNTVGICFVKLSEDEEVE